MRKEAQKNGEKNAHQNSAVVLDKLEKEIISHLCEDGRKPFQTIARDLHVDEKTVRNRVGKLREQGLLQIIPTGNANDLRDCIVAVVGINVSSHFRSKLSEIVKKLEALPMVSWIGVVMGRYDLLLEVVVSSRHALTEFQTNEVSSIEGVGHTEGFLILSHHGKRGVPFVKDILDPDN